MNILLKFDYAAHLVYVPDGYITDIGKVQENFFEWLYDMPEYIIRSSNGNMGFSYDENAVLQYINQIILGDSKEKAYFISKNTKGEVYTLKF